MLPRLLKVVEGELALSNNTWTCGEKITIADFFIGGIYTNWITNPNVPWGKDKYAKLMEDHATFKAFGERFAAEVKGRLDTRPSYPM